jgi:acyl-CoA dehydrogenase
MLILGGSLKRREKLSARLGDVLSQLYLASATLKRFEDDGRPIEDEPLLHWGVQDALNRIETAFDGVLQNLPNRPVAWLLRALIFPVGRCRQPPSDKLSHQVAALTYQLGTTRDRLSAGMYLPSNEQDAVGALEAALISTYACEPLQEKLAKAVKSGRILAQGELAQIAQAKELGLFDAEQAMQLERDIQLRRKVIMVDDFAELSAK